MNMNAHTILYTLRRKWKLTRVAKAINSALVTFRLQKTCIFGKIHRFLLSLRFAYHADEKRKKKKKETSTSGNLATKIKLPRRQRRKATIRACKQIYNIVRSFSELKALKALHTILSIISKN